MFIVKAAFAIILACLATGGACWGAEPAAEVRVMSFNIRYGTADDGVNHWNHRKERCVAVIKRFNPDVLGTQETLGFQRDYLAKQLPEYTGIGVGRNDGRAQGEMVALFFRKDRFKQLDGGHFWLSETPDRVGSKSWDSSLPRMVTWVKLQDKRTPTAPPITFYNTHFDHLGSVARLESAKLLRRRIETQSEQGSVVVTGDFNADEGSQPYRALFGAIDSKRSPVVDAYRAAHSRREAAEGTYSGFNARATKGPRIDWIGVSRDAKVLAAAIDRTALKGRTPSDHFPVTARLKFN